MNEGEFKNAQFQAMHMDHTSFFGRLLGAIYKADMGNRAKLSMGFPEEVESVTRWQQEDGYSQKLMAAYENGRGTIGKRIQ